MANRKKCLVDTSVIIALFRGNEEARKALETFKQEEAFICDVTILEILAGCFTAERREKAMNMLDVFGRINGSELVFDKAILLMKRYCVRQTGHSSLMLPDCLIAAFASFYKMKLLTFNKKDFDFIHGLDIHPLSW